MHFNLAFSECSTGIYQAFDGQTDFLRVFNFTILSYSQKSQKFDAHEEYILQYIGNIVFSRISVSISVSVSVLLTYLW